MVQILLFYTHSKNSLNTEGDQHPGRSAELTLSRRNYAVAVPGQDYIDDLTTQSKLLKQFGVLQTEPDWSKIVDTTIAKQALG